MQETDYIRPESEPALTPSELARSARIHIESRFNEVRVTGELSNFRRPGSGHWYFSIKDDSAQIRCAMFVGRNRFAKMQPRDGMAVILRGRVSLYEARGDFQIIVDHMEAAGDGALRLAYEALLKQLHTEGLTAPERKRALPTHPRRIAVVTSESGAALQDMLSVWRRRYPVAEVVVLDTAVQGDRSEAQVLRALDRVAGLNADLAIITRGGGSLEDLWTFNMESVARAVAAMPVPTISAIGHEIDVAITDYVADVRAPTPSAAAELCTPSLESVLAELAAQERVLTRSLRGILDQLTGRVERLRAGLVSPQKQLEQWMQRLDDLSHRAARATSAKLSHARHSVETMQLALNAQHPRRLVDAGRQKLEALATRAEKAAIHNVERQRAQVHSLIRTLNAVSPLNTLGRGYAILTDSSGNALTHTNSLTGDVQAHLADGYAELTVKDIHPGRGLAAAQPGDSKEHSK